MPKCTIDIEGGPEIILHGADAQEIIILAKHLANVDQLIIFEPGTIIEVKDVPGPISLR